MSHGIVEITPEDSVVPVFLDTTPQVPIEPPEELLLPTAAVATSPNGNLWQLTVSNVGKVVPVKIT